MMINISSTAPNQGVANHFTTVADIKAKGVANILPQAEPSPSGVPSSFFQEVIPFKNDAEPISDEQAMKAAKEAMKAFYTQSLQALFEEIDNADEDDPIASETYHGLLVEQIAARMSNTITRAHERLAEAVKSIDQKKAKERGKNEEDFSSKEDKNAPSFFPVGGLYA
jgi:hypothetical protein